MQTTITVRKIDIKTGIGKSGEAYERRSYYAEGSGIYSAFVNKHNKEMLNGIKVGMSIAIDVAQFKPGSYNILKVIGIGMTKPTFSGTASSGPKLSEIPMPNPLTDEEIDAIEAEAKKRYTDDIGKEDGIFDSTMASQYIAAKLQQQGQRFNLELSRYIESKKKENIEKVQRGKA
jgi:hypothetical protein